MNRKGGKKKMNDVYDVASRREEELKRKRPHFQQFMAGKDGKDRRRPSLCIRKLNDHKATATKTAKKDDHMTSVASTSAGPVADPRASVKQTVATIVTDDEESLLEDAVNALEVRVNDALNARARAQVRDKRADSAVAGVELMELQQQDLIHVDQVDDARGDGDAADEDGEDDGQVDDAQRLADARRQGAHIATCLKKRKKNAYGNRREKEQLNRILSAGDKAYRCSACRIPQDTISYQCSCGKCWCVGELCKKDAVSHMKLYFHMMMSVTEAENVMQSLKNNIELYLNNGGCMRLFASDVDLLDENLYAEFSRISAMSDSKVTVHWSVCDRGMDLFHGHSKQLIKATSDEFTNASCTVNAAGTCGMSWRYAGREPPAVVFGQMITHYNMTHKGMCDMVSRCPAAECKKIKPFSSWYAFRNHLKRDHPFHNGDVVEKQNACYCHNQHCTHAGSHVLKFSL